MNAIFALLCVHELSSIETLPIAPWKLRFTVWPAALGDAKLSADGDTITPFGVVVGFTTTGTSSEFAPSTTENVHEPTAVGDTVNCCGEAPPPPVGSIVGSGALAVVEVTVNVWAPAPGPLNPRLLGVTATEFAPGTGPLVGVGPGTMTVDEPPLLPPPQPARNTTAPTTAKNGRKRESIAPDLLATFDLDQTPTTLPQMTSLVPSAKLIVPLPALSTVAVAIGSVLRTIVTANPVAVRFPVTE